MNPQDHNSDNNNTTSNQATVNTIENHSLTDIQQSYAKQGMTLMERHGKTYDYEGAENPGTEFNVNDQAYSQSSNEDYIETVSKFHHASGEDENPLSQNSWIF